MISPVFFVFLSLSSLVNVALSQLVCPADNQQTYVDPASQSTYVIECGYDRPGEDVPGSPGWTNTLEECIALCSKTSQCVNVGYIPGSPGPCYMKRALSSPVPKAGMMAAHLPSAEGPGCPASNGKCLDVKDQGTCYETECDSTRAGKVLLQVITTTFQDCIDECEANFLNGCTYVNFVPGKGTILPGGTCTLQSTYSQSLTSSPGSWGSIRESICPNRNGGNITIWQGKTYLLECGTDLYGGDMMSPIWTAGIFDCMVACDNTPGCIAVSWHWGYPTGPCYLKNVINPGDSNAAVNAAYWLPDCYSGISTVSKTVYTSTAVHTVTPHAYVEYTPMYQYNLQRLSSSAPLSYGANPSPSTVPGGPQCYGWVGPGCSGNYKRGALPEPTASPDVAIKARNNPSFCAPSTTVTQTLSIYLSTQTTLQSTCTYYAKAATTTVPAYCEPTFQFNLPAPPSGIGGIPDTNVSIAPSIVTVNKLDCCTACTRIFNCVWWNFEFGVNTPNDTWAPGTCTIAYFTGIGDLGDNTPAVCPNGIYNGNDWFKYANGNDGYSNAASAWYNTGYNPGACGGALNLFESNWDIGLPPGFYDNQCPGQNLKD